MLADAGPWHALFGLLYNNGPGGLGNVYGWTRGIRWTVSYHFMKLELGANSVELNVTVTLGKVPPAYLEISSTTEDDLVTVLLFADQIVEDVINSTRRRVSPSYLIGQMRAAKEAINASKFPQWVSSLSREQFEDPLMEKLIDKYRGEHRDVIDKASAIIRDSLLSACRMYGVRFVSITSDDLICFEGLRANWPPMKQPMSWVVCDLLDLNTHGTDGTPPQASISYHGFLLKQHWGVYDLRQNDFEWAAFPVTLKNMNVEEINKKYDEANDLLEWLTLCGATNV